ncbi:DUF6683 family protein [Conexibacter woesei]|uniref:Uncharacterized protein n=1 Tax=Conexibacter woesei (strain DSM 14684 / CCUG 47730 / CIP 108061 / JCM 11494 / NBRC 100937 / ID131577) TaxID=469383 RepID=D3FB88_CONWI|nr:DUF6683 family protein [Conexibacter woesei]ADB53280.1 hypothetical protein Cwoe_4868 [Conexibacter woesei DSM 14684]
MTITKTGARTLLGAIAAGVLLALPGPASAQLDGPATPYVDAVGAWANAQTLRRDLESGGGTGTAPARGRAPRRATARQLAALRFTPSAGVTRANDDAVIAKLPSSYDPVRVRAVLAELRAEGRKVLRANGLRGNDLGDVATFDLMLLYLVYHDLRSDPPRAAVAALRREVRNDIAANPATVRLSDARKQTAAEMIDMKRTFLLADWPADALGRSDRRAEIRTWVRAAFGVDLRAVRLTARGFVAR